MSLSQVSRADADWEHKLIAYEGDATVKTGIVILRVIDILPQAITPSGTGIFSASTMLNTRFSTQSQKYLYATKPNLLASEKYTDEFKADFESSTAFNYSSASDKFVAVEIPIGTYRYVYSTLINMRYFSRFSPTKNIEFTLNEGEVKYVGDLKLILTEEDLTEQTTIFGKKFVQLREDVLDFQFKVDSDFDAAREFYLSLPNRPNKPLEMELMTISDLTKIRYYSEKSCNFISQQNGRVTPMSFCHFHQSYGIE